MKLRNLLTEAEYVSIGFGRYKQKGKEKDASAPTFKKDDKGNFVPFSDKKSTTGGDKPAEEKPKVNIFDKPTEEPKKEPTSNISKKRSDEFFNDSKAGEAIKQLLGGSWDRNKVQKYFDNLGNGDDVKWGRMLGFIASNVGIDSKKYTSSGDLETAVIDSIEGLYKLQNDDAPKSTQKRSGNPTVNKATRQLAQKIGMTPDEFGSKEEYQTAMVGAAYEALVDSNYHSEARNLLAIVTGDKKLADKPNYPSFDDPEYDEKMAKINKDREAANKYTNNDEFTKEFAQKVAKESGWDGVDAIDGIAYELRMNGFGTLADKLQSSINKNEIKLKEFIKRNK
jgi:hypothetical protein